MRRFAGLLAECFCERQDTICRTADEPWRQAHVSRDVAAHDPATDVSLTDTIRHADKGMYENKERHKAQTRT